MPQPGTTVEETLGLELLELREDYASGRFAVEERVMQHMGVVHGGVYATLAESLASHATHLAVQADGLVALGLSNSTNFLRPVSEGEVRAEARRRHGGRTTWIWDVELSDGAGRLCAVARVTVAVRPDTRGDGS